MFECCIAICLPIRKVGDTSRLSFIVAKYNYDPGLYPQDHVRVNNAPFVRTKRNGQPIQGDEPLFSFDAQVLRRKKIVEPDVSGDKFILLIELEIADKEQMPEILKLIKSTFVGEYEECSIEAEAETE